MKKQPRFHSFACIAAFMLGCTAIAPAAFADSTPHDKAHAKTKAKAKKAKPAEEEKAYGRPGDPKKVNRVIFVDMRDNMRFSPDSIRVRQGETVKFVVKNKGKLLHEIVIGTMDEFQTHAKAMKKHPGMEHDEPNMVHVDPGHSKDLVWQFTQPGEFDFACLVAGHFEAGMTGRITVIKE